MNNMLSIRKYSIAEIKRTFTFSGTNVEAVIGAEVGETSGASGVSEQASS